MSHSLEEIIKAVHRAKGNAMLLIVNGEVEDIYVSDGTLAQFKKAKYNEHPKATDEIRFTMPKEKRYKLVT